MVRKKLRGMLALLLSLSMAVGLMGGTALAAEGETVIEHAELIDRGYERLEDMLCALGADAGRMDTGAESAGRKTT